MRKTGTISSPGRICLFGEHQDYLGLPVIPMAINKRLKLLYQLEKKPSYVQIKSNQLDHTEKISTEQYPDLNGSPYDYQKSVFIFFWKKIGDILPSRIWIDSKIPIRGGLSSSAAIMTSMVYLFTILLEENVVKKKIAEIAYICEHDIMGISCGRMDQYACSLGKIFHMSSEENPKITPLNLSKDAFFIIGNSQIERKADIPLKKVQQEIFRALNLISNPNLQELNQEDIKNSKLSQLHRKRLIGVIGIRDNTEKALTELKKGKPDLIEIGKLLSEQQSYLRENYQVSHPKIDKMCDIAMNNGALGAKLTGAGFGGCMFAITHNKKTAVRIKDALRLYGESHITKMDLGVKKQKNDL